MDQPWGLSGPEFLVLYGVALLGLLLLVVVVTLLTKVGGGAADDGGGREPNGDEELGLYESAYLFDGVDRVADTAVAGLVAADSLRVSRSHALSPTRSTGDDEYQNRALEESWSDLNRVRRAFRVSDLGEPLRLSLQQRGLVVKESRRRVAAALAWLFPLLGLVGIVRLLNGVAHGYPVGLLVLELFVTVIVWAVARVAGKEPRPTWAGERAKRRRRERDASLRSPYRAAGSAEPMTAMVLVSVGGMSAYPDPGLAPFLAPWLSSSGSGGGGSGGGGSGGGGGGGCGGGGGG